MNKIHQKILLAIFNECFPEWDLRIVNTETSDNKPHLVYDSDSNIKAATIYVSDKFYFEDDFRFFVEKLAHVAACSKERERTEYIPIFYEYVEKFTKEFNKRIK